MQLECGNTSSFLFLTGRSYYQREDFSRAEEYFLAAVDLDRRDALPWMHLGHTYYSQGKYVDAEESYNMCLSARNGSYSLTIAVSLVCMKEFFVAGEWSGEGVEQLLLYNSIVFCWIYFGGGLFLSSEWFSSFLSTWSTIRPSSKVSIGDRLFSPSYESNVSFHSVDFSF